MSLMSTAADSSMSAVESIEFRIELTRHEKMLLLAAIANYKEERLKMAGFMNGSDSATGYFADAGRIDLIGQKLAKLVPSDPADA